MNVLNLEALQAAKAEKRKAETLEKIAACLSVVHYSNIDYVFREMVEHAEKLAYIYCRPGAAAEHKKYLAEILGEKKKALPVRQH